MKTDYPRYVNSLFIILLITWIISCSGRAGKNNPVALSREGTSNTPTDIRFMKMISPEENSGFKLHDQIKVVMEQVNKTAPPDSVSISFNGNAVTAIKSAPWEYTIPSSYTNTTGRKSLKVTTYKDGRAQMPITRFMIIYSDIIPKKYGYKIINSYPHDKEAFTQGLIYDRGEFLEGTGQIASSSLREVEPVTGKVIRQHNLDDKLFGEGIALLNDRIYQVTWQDKVGFIYDRSTFNLINKIYYSTEGWGLTTIDNKIVMSDGTNVLYYFEPDMFTVVSRIEVYDNEKKVDSLNELEYINGEIWANIWMTDLLARIDPVTGKVLAYVDLKGILPESERNSNTDVLNGIAYDKSGDRIFITGKNWPKLYEIRLTD